MPTVTALYVYPVKSCRGLSLDRARLTRWGLQWDRHWMLVDPGGRFVSQREYPVMARIEPQLDGQRLCLAMPGVPPLVVLADAAASRAAQPVTIWNDTLPAIDEGDMAARWFSDVLGASVRLVRFDETVRRQVSPRWTAPGDAATQFADGFPLLVTAQESLDELNARLLAKGAPAIPMDRFRPNIVLSGVEAYDEDFMDTVTIGEDGAVTLRLVKPCARCPIPTINQATGTRDAAWPHEPLDTMSEYRANPLVEGGLTFGQNAMAIRGEGQHVRVGATVQFEWNFLENI